MLIDLFIKIASIIIPIVIILGIIANHLGLNIYSEYGEGEKSTGDKVWEVAIVLLIILFGFGAFLLISKVYKEIWF